MVTNCLEKDQLEEYIYAPQILYVQFPGFSSVTVKYYPDHDYIRMSGKIELLLYVIDHYTFRAQIGLLYQNSFNHSLFATARSLVLKEIKGGSDICKDLYVGTNYAYFAWNLNELCVSTP